MFVGEQRGQEKGNFHFSAISGSFKNGLYLWMFFSILSFSIGLKMSKFLTNIYSVESKFVSVV